MKDIEYPLVIYEDFKTNLRVAGCLVLIPFTFCSFIMLMITVFDPHRSLFDFLELMAVLVIIHLIIYLLLFLIVCIGFSGIFKRSQFKLYPNRLEYLKEGRLILSIPVCEIQCIIFDPGFARNAGYPALYRIYKKTNQAMSRATSDGKSAFEIQDFRDYSPDGLYWLKKYGVLFGEGQDRTAALKIPASMDNSLKAMEWLEQQGISFLRPDYLES